MSASLSPSKAPPEAPGPGSAPPRGPVPAYLRSKSEISAEFRRKAGHTRIDTLYEGGCARLKFPRTGRDCNGVIVNTAGGMTGGDEARWSYKLHEGAHVGLTTQSAEKIYRSDRDVADVRVAIKLGKRASLAWLPQEIILFNGARFSRRLEADLAEGAQLTVLEISVFGRTARGERVTEGSFNDRWLVRRGGRIVFAESVKLEGDIAARLAEPAVGGGATAVATLLHVAPNAERRLGPLRRLLSRAATECGASAWDGMLIARFASNDVHALRRDAALAASRFLKEGLPRIWSL
jgi:urease accessory protein